MEDRTVVAILIASLISIAAVAFCLMTLDHESRGDTVSLGSEMSHAGKTATADSW